MARDIGHKFNRKNLIIIKQPQQNVVLNMAPKFSVTGRFSFTRNGFKNVQSFHTKNSKQVQL